MSWLRAWRHSAWFTSRVALRFLVQSRVQTAVILTGVIVGVGVIVFLYTLIAGLQRNTIQRTIGTQAHIVLEPADLANVPAAAPPGTVQLVLEDQRPQRLQSLDGWPQLVEALAREPQIVAVSPMMSGPASVRRGDALESVTVLGVDPQRYLEIVALDDNMRTGRFDLTPGNAVIGARLADTLGVSTGQKIRLESGNASAAVLTIAGVFEMGVRELDARYVYTDMKQAQSLLQRPGGASRIEVTVDDIFAVQPLAQRLGRLLDLKAESWMQTNAQILNALRAQAVSTTMISVLVALSVAIGIAAVLAVSVTQRTREIGILRAMGTTRRQMLSVFVLQGAWLGFCGAALGACLGLGMTAAFRTFGPNLFPTPVLWSAIPWSMGLATISGMLAASLPAWRAARMDPAEAIRYV